MADQPSDAIVFFGATGDLAYKQIFPALLGLVRDEGLNVPIIGVAKAGWNLDKLKERAADSLQHHGGGDPKVQQRLMDLLRYVDGDYNDDATFTELRKQLGKAQRPLHYLAVPPSLFATVSQALSRSGCAENARLVIEKPFGHNRATALALSRLLESLFPEENIFRIDHYMGKEPVQNIVYTRFANSIFEPLWNRDHIGSIQITMAEDFGVQDRGHFYDETGAIRDVVQNHMLQVLAQLTMDPPTGEEHEAMRDQKAALLKAVRPLDPAACRARSVRGLPGGAGRARRLHRGNLRGREAVHRHLAVGGRADLHPRRQEFAHHRDRGAGSVQAPAARNVRGTGAANVRSCADADQPRRLDRHGRSREAAR